MRETRIGPGSPVAEMGSKDGRMSLRLYQEGARNGVHTVRIVQRGPRNMDRFDAQLGLLNQLDPDRELEDEKQLITTAGYSGEINTLGRINNFPELVAGMGYRFSEETENKGATTERTIRFEYPTVDRLNEFTQGAFPDGDTVQFTEYSGGHYSAVEFISSLANDGKVLIASKQPYQLHEHVALHVLGWVGLGGKYLQHIRPTYRSFLARMEAEKDLPDVPGFGNRHVAEFLQPTLQVLKGGMRSLDDLSFEIGETVFVKGPDQNWTTHELLQRRLESSFSLRQNNSAIPNNMLVEPGTKVLAEFANDTLGRYTRAERFVQATAKVSA